MNQEADVTLQNIPISEEEFLEIRDMVSEHFGISLTEQKKSLIVGRLQRHINELRLSSFAEYIRHVKADPTGRELSELINRISTNHTFFYREMEHFEFFQKAVLPEITSRLEQLGDRDLRIWSAGCSSGEEPYTLIMLMKEFFGQRYASWRAGVLATDISARMIQLAKEGIYPEDRVNQLPPRLRQQYFRKTPNGQLEIAETVKKEAVLRHFNLMNSNFPFKNPFHIIFCRNVMIYFDQPTRDALVQRFFKFTAPGGYLFVGHSESLNRNTCPYQYVMPAVYRKEGPACSCRPAVSGF